ncbi:MAG: ribosome maturation factor RimP [Acidothermus sp.]|nr:ribosome maturation factor RimP [Acidothermus sp.]MCL6537603.1 ribosome maturation factor RimP [Acidothermus sp.]
MSESSARLAELLAPIVAAEGLDLEHVNFHVHGDTRSLQILVDRDGGVRLDDIAKLSRRISDFLDTDAEADALIGSAPYSLEVSSPGIDRPLTEPRHWRRAVGHLVRIRLPDLGTVVARIREVQGDQVRLAVRWRYGQRMGAVRHDEERTVPIAEVSPGTLEVEFDRAEEAYDFEEGFDDEE